MGGAVAIFVTAILVGLYFVYDRRRYRGQTHPGQRPTHEVFRDPATGQRMRVYEDPETGKRDYRPD